MTLPAEALGLVIRELRETATPSLSQEQLGRAAGYGAGAGVSISRIEGGLTRPGAARFAGIALALGLTPAQLQDLADARAAEQRALERSGLESPRTSGARRRATRERLAEVQQRVTQRCELIRTEGEAFNAAHDRAREDFAEPFAALTARTDNAPSTSAETNGLAGLRQQSGATVAMAIEKHGSPAEGSAGWRLDRNRVITLVSLAVAPAGVLAAGGLLWLARRRNQREEEQLRLQLAEVEAGLNLSQPGFDALADLLPEMSELLEYIAVHAGHALRRFEATLPPGQIDFANLLPAQAVTLREFRTIADCQQVLDQIDVGALLTGHPAQLPALLAEVNETMRETSRLVRELV